MLHREVENASSVLMIILSCSIVIKFDQVIVYVPQYITWQQFYYITFLTNFNSLCILMIFFLKIS